MAKRFAFQPAVKEGNPPRKDNEDQLTKRDRGAGGFHPAPRRRSGDRSSRRKTFGYETVYAELV